MKLHDLIELIRNTDGTFNPVNKPLPPYFDVLAYSNTSAKVSYKGAFYYCYYNNSCGLPALTIEPWEL